ncbi:MAG: glutamine synthetase family protein [Candidatus Aenigmarchaeota archaeon]|nr:glutamine synthetase family protein [Candidatus Aenigmarchaeota archaeon]
MITSSLEKMGVKFVEAGFLDLQGVLRSRIFPAKRFDAIHEDGFGFDGSSVGFVGIEDSDVVAKPIGNTCKIIPSYGFKTAFSLCEIEKNGKTFEWSGREILKDMINKIKDKHNYIFCIGPELEFFITKDGQLLDEAGYMSSNPMDKSGPFKKQFMNNLESLHPDFNIHVSHHEVSPSQHEFELKYDKPVEMIDKLVCFKHILRNFALEYDNSEITFMPKPFFGQNGSGMHFHMSMWENNIPLFYENKDEISDLAKQFIAGILSHSKEIALTSNNTVNSYKRLVLGHEAPVFLVWGYGNRSASIRIPKYQAIRPERARIEIRTPDALNNHYLTIAAIIHAGMKGIEESMDAFEPFQKNTYKLKENECEELGIEILPRNLQEAIDHAKKGTILKELLGKRFDAFIERKQKEWEDYCRYLDNLGIYHETNEVTDWERKRYFSM